MNGARGFRFIALLSLLGTLSACGGSVEGMVAESYGITDATRIRWDLLDLIFPVVGPARFENDWHAERDGGARLHEGNDLLAKKLVPVVAVADGTVSWVRAKVGGECCYLGITHDSQGVPYESRYMHLNNDTPGTDDGKVIGIAKGIKKGVHVQAGQLIGWVGDSGNAEHTVPHLHFELIDEFGNPINPYLVLERARHLDRVLVGEATTSDNKLLTAEEQDDPISSAIQLPADR
ncbi:MAG: M23 family metallopeptidase [Bdellovibrionales bacterium]|nr:M23 family metallopeptidase [Bdellovibrionales bacterium]